MSFDLTQKIKIVNPHASNDLLYGTYNSVAEALTGVPSVLRMKGRTVGIIENGGVVEYWFKDGIADTDLVVKSSGGSEDTLDDVAKRGNYSSVEIKIQDQNYKFSINPVSNTRLLGGNVNTQYNGTNNILVGTSWTKATTANLNVAIGAGALKRATTGFANTFIGADDNNVTTDMSGKHNSALGYLALSAVTSGKWNIGIGTAAGNRITTGEGNISIGYAANNYGNTGSRNICIGTYAGMNRASEATFSNKLVIENRLPNVNNTFWDLTPLPTGFSVTNSFIYGDFENRTLNFDARISVTPTRMPNATAAETKKVVWNPTTGVFAVKDDTSSTSANKQRFTGDTTSAKTLSHTPMTNSVSVILNGIELDEQGGDYTVSDTTVTLANEPLITDVIVIKYLY